MEKSGYGTDGIYRSLRPPLLFPKDPNLSMFPFLFRNASSSYPNRIALADADSGETLTFHQLKSTVQKIASGLSRSGIKKGDVVLIFAPNSIHFPLCFLAIVAIGAIATTVNPLYTVAELSKQAKDSGSVLVITVPELWPNARELHLPAIIIGSKTTPISGDVTYLSDLIDATAADLPPTQVRQTDTAALMYSSGTTGISKGVVLTHRNFICAALMVTADQENEGEPPNTFLCFLPMFHIFGLSVITYAQLQRSNCVVTMGRFELEMVLKSVEKYRVTHLCVVPPVMIALAKQNVAKKYDLSSLKQLVSGAAPLGKDVMEDCAKLFPQAVVIQVI